MPLWMWIPIEPILRASPAGGGSSPTQTPVSPSNRPRLDAVVGERGDHRRAPCLPTKAGTLIPEPEVHDRIGDELSGAVVGEPAAAVGVDDLDPLHPVPVLAHRQLVGRRATPARVDGRMLEQQQRVGHGAGRALGGDRLLQPRGLLVADEARPDHA